MNDCANCEDDGGQCYECYILSGDEDRDRELFEKGLLNA